MKFPIGLVLDDRWRIVEALRGVPDRGMYRARGREDEPVLVTMTNEQAVPAAQQRRALALELPGVTPLLAVTAVEVPSGRYDVLVEAEPDGVPLSSFTGAMSLAAAATIGRGLAVLLREAHARGVVFGVLRPEITYVRKVGLDLRLIAIAPRAERFFRTSKRVCYGVVTPFDWFYEAPESSRTTTLAPSADVFSLCAILSHVVTGHHPFAGEGPLGQLQGIARGERRSSATGAGATIPPIINAGLALDPNARPTLRELDDALAALD